MSKEKFVVFYEEYAEVFALLSNEEVGRLGKAMFEYAKTGRDIKLEGNERYVWPTIRAQIDFDLSREDVQHIYG